MVKELVGRCCCKTFYFLV